MLELVLQAAKAVEEAEYTNIRQRALYPELAWPALAVMQEKWQAARVTRAQAELQLWLADRQWEREETEAREGTPTLLPDPLPVSPITKR